MFHGLPLIPTMRRQANVYEHPGHSVTPELLSPTLRCPHESPHISCSLRIGPSDRWAWCRFHFETDSRDRFSRHCIAKRISAVRL